MLHILFTYFFASKILSYTLFQETQQTSYIQQNKEDEIKKKRKQWKMYEFKTPP